jgi:hypothetical protein
MKSGVDLRAAHGGLYKKDLLADDVVLAIT